MERGPRLVLCPALRWRGKIKFYEPDANPPTLSRWRWMGAVGEKQVESKGRVPT